MKILVRLLELMWGKNALITNGKEKMISSFQMNIRDWMNCFRIEPDFGSGLLTKINVRFQRFLYSCSLNDPSDIDLEALDFTKFIDKVRKGEIIITTPLWLVACRKKKQSEGNSTKNSSERTSEDPESIKKRGNWE